MACVPVAQAVTSNKIGRDANGELKAPEAPGLGIEIDPAGVRQYLQKVEIRVNGRTLYETPAV